MSTQYQLTGKLDRIPFEYAALVISRVRPLLNTSGLAAHSVEHLLCEAYIQGLRDASEAMEGKQCQP